jgi:hypothetical protein
MRVAYWIIGAAVVALMVVGLITYGAHEASEAAQQKAATLTQSFEQATSWPMAPRSSVAVR